MMKRLPSNWLRYTRLALLTGAFLLPACGLVPGLEPAPEIAAVTAVSAVNAWDEGVTLLHPTADTPPRLAIRVDLIPGQPLRPFLARVGRSLQARASPCRDGAYDWRAQLGVLGVFDSEGAITDDPAGTAASLVDRPREARFYVLVVTQALGRPVHTARSPGMVDGHDLRHDAADVCVVLVTVIVPFGGATSNSVRIPYADIRAALDRAGM